MGGDRMSLYTGKQLTKEEAEKFNKDLVEIRCNPEKYGSSCISCRPCDNCYIMVFDTICLCVGNFTCPKCGFENGIKYINRPLVFSPITFNIPIDFGSEFNWL